MQQTFRELEYQGWMEKAGAYDDYFAMITRQAIPAMLDTFGELSAIKLLDISSGTGHLPAAAASRGAQVEGIDFAGAMVDRAMANYPELSFREGDAQDLPYADANFDAVTCAFGIHHLEHPQQGFMEAYRVLRPRGRYTFTTWASPEQGQEFIAAIHNAVNMHGSTEVNLPAAPAMPSFGGPGDSCELLSQAGFIDTSIDILPLVWEAQRAEDALDMIYRGIVRIPMMLNAQSESARTKIHAEIIDQLRRFESSDGIKVPFPAVIVSVLKPDTPPT